MGNSGRIQQFTPGGTASYLVPTENSRDGFLVIFNYLYRSLKN